MKEEEKYKKTLILKRWVVNKRKTKEYDVYIGRPSKWGSPFVVGKHGTRKEVLKKYTNYLYESGLINSVNELKGKVLGCWCYPKPCHGDILVKLANEEKQKGLFK